MSVGTAGEKGEKAVAGGANGAKDTNGEECDAEVGRGGGRARGPVRRYSSRREASTAAAWAPSLVVAVWWVAKCVGPEGSKVFTSIQV